MVPSGYSERYTADIKAGNNLLGTVTSYINNDTIIEDHSNVILASDKNAQIVNGLDINNLLDTGKVEKDLSSYINGPETSGMFQKNTNPNTPLFETRSQFVDQSKFFGSDYFYQKIGLNLTDVQTEFEQQNKRLVGDQFFQAKIIEEQLKTIRKNALLLSDSGTNANTETQSLLDNAADEYTRLGLTANETLTQTQIDSLEKDIVWFETETINGELYVVPKIYLTKATRDSLNNNDSLTTKSTIMAMGDLQLNSDSLSNSGSIVGNNVAISTTNDITNNNFSDIIATNGLNLTSNSGSIINFSKLKAGGAFSLTAANNITNTSTVKTNAANLLDSDNLAYISNGSAASNSGNISSTLIETALIEAGSFTANAGNDFSNYGADITTTGDTSISAGNNVNIEAVQLRDRSEQRWGNKKKGGVKITDTTTNIGSNINIGGNLVLASTNDTLIKGSDISVDGNATINTAGDLNIVSATDSYYAFESSHKKGSFGRRSSSSSTVNKTTNIESNINVAGDINSNSQENINIIASNLTSGGNINLNATKAVNILAGQDTSYSKTQRNKKGTTIIKRSADIAYDITNVHSNLNATGNIALTSGTNTNLVGANLDAGNNIDVNAGDELMIAAVADESYRYSDSTKTRSMATIAKYTGISATLKTYGALADSADFISKPLEGAGLNVGATIVSGVVNYAQNLAEGDVNSKTKSNVTKTKNYQLSKLDAKNNLNITSNNNINLIGVDINTVNDTIITSNNGDINIANVKDSYYNKNETKKSKTTFTSLATDLVKTPLLIVSSVVSGYNMLQHPDKKKQTLEDNKAAMGQKSQKQFTQINSVTDETIIASNVNTNNLTINSGRDTIITSTDINANNNLSINSDNNTIIIADFENDSSFSLTKKQNPNIVAAISNGIVDIVGNAMPDFSFKKPDDKEHNKKKQREGDSLDHNPHSQDINVATNTDNAMINGYTISNNDPDELAYDTNLNKRTEITKTHIASNINSNNDININSNGGNNTIIASNITADNNININSSNGTATIASAADKSFIATSTVAQDYNNIETNYDRGRVSVDANINIYEQDTKSTSTTQKSSNITANNNININTKDDINILSSNLTSNNEINLASTTGNTNIAANKNTQSTETEIREGTMTLSAGIGHVAVDAAYAVDGTIKAVENLKKANDNLSHIKNLHKQGKATKDAVDDAKANLGIATLNVTLAYLKQSAAAEKAVKSSATLGFYGDVKLTRTGDKTNTTSNQTQEIASNITANNNININSGASITNPNSSPNKGNTNIKGNVTSINSDINITSKNNTNITALKNTENSSSKTEGFTQSTTIGASYGDSVAQRLIESLSAQLSKRTGESTSSSTNYTNTNLIATKGAININSTNSDTNIIGANLNADNITINTANNLNIESLQNTSNSKSKSKSIGAGGGSGSGSLSYNANRSESEQNWVNDQTTIIANDNFTINTGNNTDLKGGLIASKTDNLTINTKMLTFSDIIDSESSESSGVGFSTNIGIGSSSNPNSTNPNQDRSYYPNGSTSLSFSNQGYEKEQITRATIGGGTINITDSDNSDNLAELNRDIAKSQEIMKDTITGALDVSATIDNRFFDLTGKGQKEIWKEAKNLPGSPVRVSRYIDENNNTLKKDGSIKDNPAPTLIPGLFMKDSEMGRDYDRDEATNQKIVPSFPSSLLSGTKANPVFKFLNHVFPGGKSGTEYHDAGMTHKKGEQKKDSVEKAVTIFPYFLLNYYGAAGTILDVPNWKKNFLPQKDNKQINQLNNINNGNKNKQNE